MKHLRVLLNFGLLATSDLVKLILSVLPLLTIILALLALVGLLESLISSAGPTLLELIINVLHECQHLDGDVPNNKEQLSVVHVSYICAQWVCMLGIGVVALFVLGLTLLVKHDR